MGDHGMSAPGWYRDPHDASSYRWWDGTAWTHHVRPAETSQPDAQATPALQARVRAEASRAEILADGAAELRAEIARLTVERDALRSELVETRELVLLQQVGIYQFAHPLEDSTEYAGRISAITARLKELITAGNAVTGTDKWAINGSLRAGAKMVADHQKLLLRTYNTEAESTVRSMKAYALEAALARLEKARDIIRKFGAAMSIDITDDFHALRREELRLTADYRVKLAEEKEREREERARLKEEEAARRELEREKARLEKEQAHYAAVVAAMAAKGDTDGLARAQEGLLNVQHAIEGVVARAANVRAGYVYVISNIGAFGERVVKIGMTRRLEPMDRVRELGDASVPFRFDVHALVFSDDAVGLETLLHRRFAHARVNMINAHREFFYVHPSEVRDALRELRGELLHFAEIPEALEWRQSETLRAPGAPTSHATEHDGGLASRDLENDLGRARERDREDTLGLARELGGENELGDG